MASEALTKTIERQDFLEQASDAIQPAVRNAFEAADPAGQGDAVRVSSRVREVRFARRAPDAFSRR